MKIISIKLKEHMEFVNNISTKFISTADGAELEFDQEGVGIIAYHPTSDSKILVPHGNLRGITLEGIRRNIGTKGVGKAVGETGSAFPGTKPLIR